MAIRQPGFNRPALARRCELVVARRAMACDFSISFPAGVRSGVDAGCAALDEVERLEGKLSVYRGDSDLSFINRCAAERAGAGRRRGLSSAAPGCPSERSDGRSVRQYFRGARKVVGLLPGSAARAFGRGAATGAGGLRVAMGSFRRRRADDPIRAAWTRVQPGRDRKGLRDRSRAPRGAPAIRNSMRPDAGRAEQPCRNRRTAGRTARLAGRDRRSVARAPDAGDRPPAGSRAWHLGIRQPVLRSGWTAIRPHSRPAHRMAGARSV